MMDPATAFTEKRVELFGNPVEIALPSYLPADAASTL
jgi:putative transposon-encoded protein